ncbi:MAG: EamA family transporter RarD [Desulfobacteraceae bacterium]|nr:EamA family transporter RarD [Desulfobacteraceae bacterium]
MEHLKIDSNRNLSSGIAFLLPAYLIWGLCPIFWKLLSHVSSFELLLHRTIWSLMFLLVIIGVQKRGNELLNILKSPSTVGLLSLSTLTLAFNWYLFIWAVNHDEVLQTSLAYYINPLLIVFLGMMFLKEKLRKSQVIALIIASTGVGYYTLFLGQFPWISIAIAVSFAIYGLMHKMMSVLPLPGLCIETLLLSIPSSGYLFFLHINGNGTMMNISFSTDLLLIGTCLVTGLPLLFFTIGTKRSTLTTVGFMQYIAPCCSFLLAVFYYKEPFSVEKLITFVMIWIALGIYTFDSIYQHKDKFLKSKKG